MLYVFSTLLSVFSGIGWAISTGGISRSDPDQTHFFLVLTLVQPKISSRLTLREDSPKYIPGCDKSEHLHLRMQLAKGKRRAVKDGADQAKLL